ncbi:MAG: alpha/beta hydrolase, partial [Betaproteobacteria bacterium]|nr:alpha/beta hydrolase [Betaproteobacteria bacterium]
MIPKAPRTFIDGPAGTLECVLEDPKPEVCNPNAPLPLAVVCHPHPLHGGTLDNKVAQTLARAFLQRGYRTVRFNFRGVEQSAGSWGEG